MKESKPSIIIKELSNPLNFLKPGKEPVPTNETSFRKYLKAHNLDPTLYVYFTSVINMERYQKLYACIKYLIHSSEERFQKDLHKLSNKSLDGIIKVLFEKLYPPYRGPKVVYLKEMKMRSCR